MRALIVTVAPPPRPRRDHQGLYQRLKMFVQAIAELCNTTEILHFVVPEFLEHIDRKAFAITQSDYWGAPLDVTLVPMRQLYAWQKAKAMYGFSPFVGEAQISVLKASISSAPDFILGHRLPAMYPLLQIDRKLPPVFFDMDDVPHRFVLRGALNSPSWRKKARGFIQIPAIVAAERRAIRLSKKTFVCSDHDRSHLRTLGMGSTVQVVPNAVDFPDRKHALSRERTILFLGNFGYIPNTEAAERLISESGRSYYGRLERHA